jgi:glycosyltransferase involved in cell wall biosynthesis
MKVAFFAPLSPMRGGVVDYSEELLPHLAQDWEIDVYTQDGLEPTHSAMRAHREHIYGYSSFLAHDRRQPYDRVIYQLGCHGDHLPDYECLMQRPGWIVLHELNLSGIIGAQTFARGDSTGYLKAVLLNEGLREASAVAWRFVRTRQFPDYLAYDFNRLALIHSQGVIVHNRFMRQAITERLRRWHVTLPVCQVPMGVQPTREMDTAEVHCARRELGLEDDAFVVGSFGVVHESKGLHMALGAFRQLLARVPNAAYLIVGPCDGGVVSELVCQLGLEGRVKLTGYVPGVDFYRYIAASDLCVNLRLPKTGGTSVTLLRLMSVGRPTIVSNQAQFVEIPDDVCLKAQVGPEAEQSVLDHMLDMAAHAEKARQIGERARGYIATEHSLERAAQAYREAVGEGLRTPENAHIR